MSYDSQIYSKPGTASPADEFSRRVSRLCCRSTKSLATSVMCGSKFSRPFGTRRTLLADPPLKGWAILESPSGRRRISCSGIARKCPNSRGGAAAPPRLRKTGCAAAQPYRVHGKGQPSKIGRESVPGTGPPYLGVRRQSAAACLPKPRRRQATTPWHCQRMPIGPERWIGSTRKRRRASLALILTGKIAG